MRLIKNPEEFEAKLRQAKAREAEKITHATRRAKGIIAAKLERHGEEVNKRYQALKRRKREISGKEAGFSSE